MKNTTIPLSEDSSFNLKEENKEKLQEKTSISKDVLLEMTTEQQPEKEKIEIQWIKWIRNSCHYESFLTVFCCVLMNKKERLFQDRVFFRDRRCPISYEHLINVARIISNKDPEAISTLWENLNRRMYPSEIEKTEVAFFNEVVGVYGSAISLLPLLSCLRIMEFIYLAGSKCFKCESRSKEFRRFDIPMILKTASSNSIQESFDNFFKQKHGLFCFNCKDKERSEKYLLLNSSGFLIVYLDTEGKSLTNFKFNKRIFVSTPVVIDGYNIDKYSLIATINHPQKGHFTCSLFCPKINGIVRSGWYYHDGMENNGKMVSENTFSKKNPIVFFYERIRE